MIQLLHATATQTGGAHRHDSGGNEDRSVAVMDAFPGPAFAVFDGHGGAAAASYLSDPSTLIARVGAELRRTIGDDLVDAMTRVSRDFQQDHVKQTQLTTAIEQEEARLEALEGFKRSPDNDTAENNEIESLEQRVREILRDMHACVGHIDQQEAVRETFMREFWKLVDQSFAGVISRAFHQVDEALLREIEPRHDGSTCVAVWLVGHTTVQEAENGITLYCANVGDSRAVLCRGSRAVALSQEQKPSDPNERERIERQGGVVQTLRGSRVPRVYSPAAAQLLPAGTPTKCLAMARSFGDLLLKQPAGCVTCEPDVRSKRLGQDDLLVVVASDGVWDALSSQEAVDLALSHFGDADGAARAIVWEAQQRGSKDDATATVVQFGWQEERVREILQMMHAEDQQRQAQEAKAFACGSD